MIPLGLKETKELDWSAALTVSACGPGGPVVPGARGALGASWSNRLMSTWGNRGPEGGRVRPEGAALPGCRGSDWGALEERPARTTSAEPVILLEAPGQPRGSLTHAPRVPLAAGRPCSQPVP